MDLTWVEISRQSLAHNMNQFRTLAPKSLLAPVVKANAYGHGLVPVARILCDEGADWLCVNAVYEAEILRREGISLPLYLLGYLAPGDYEAAVELGLKVVAYDPDTIHGLGKAAAARGATVPVHVKVETGNNRQGLPPEQAVQLARLIATTPGVEFEGLSSHYADIEDTTDHAFAKGQLEVFLNTVATLEQQGVPARVKNFSNSAAAILWAETHFDLVRAGISLYGMWPSKETCVSAVLLNREKPVLEPVLTWKTVVAQVKQVAAGEFVGYGRTFRTTHTTRLAVLPIGYYDGYDRGLSNLGHVLIDGHIAPVRGRVCMNMVMVDVSDVPSVEAGREVVLLGQSLDKAVTAENIADWSNTINYEVTTRINERIPRRIVD